MSVQADLWLVAILGELVRWPIGVRGFPRPVSQHALVAYCDFEKDSSQFRTNMPCIDRPISGKRIITAALLRMDW